MGPGDGAIGVGRGAQLELGGRAVELGRDEAGLLFHVRGVVGPDLDERLHVLGDGRIGADAGYASGVVSGDGRRGASGGVSAQESGSPGLGRAVRGRVVEHHTSATMRFSTCTP